MELNGWASPQMLRRHASTRSAPDAPQLPPHHQRHRRESGLSRNVGPAAKAKYPPIWRQPIVRLAICGGAMWGDLRGSPPVGTVG
jgi:hypothetical protein